MPDQNGYPLECELEQLEKFEIHSETDLDKLMEIVKSIWYYPEYITRDKHGRWTLITGGWSGNEHVINALHRNAFFKLLFWESSSRGGKHTYAPIGIVLQEMLL